ncbi:hypothetical protein G9A89_021330 [Geosiphon pyriformis]|nr:hypothetical protein G9A89_021330 [Geosiphon pyriformis]
MPSSCKEIRQALVECLLESECVRLNRITPKECLQPENAHLISECQAIRRSLFECKRSQLDMRTRFRGNKF